MKYWCIQHTCTLNMFPRMRAPGHKSVAHSISVINNCTSKTNKKRSDIKKQTHRLLEWAGCIHGWLCIDKTKHESPVKCQNLWTNHILYNIKYIFLVAVTRYIVSIHHIYTQTCWHRLITHGCNHTGISLSNW